MFTGIVENLGKFEKKKNSAFLFSASVVFCNKLKKGTSVSVDGVCLTVVKKNSKSSFWVDVMPETQGKTILGLMKEGEVVNLELPAKVETFLSGHVVQGHVDGVGKVKAMTTVGNSTVLNVQTKKEITDYVVNKGSITLNGVSLTVVSVGKKYFTIAIIPFTWENTMFSKIKIGDYVNIETDVLGKYLKKFLNK